MIKKKRAAVVTTQKTPLDALFEEGDVGTLPEKNLWCAVIVRAITDFKTLSPDDYAHIDARKWLWNVNSEEDGSLKFALDAVVSCSKLRRSIENYIIQMVSTKH